MLRLIVDQIAPWVDSRGLARSALQEFDHLMDEEALGALEGALAGEFTAWHLGVLTDGWPISENSKPVDLGEESADAPEVTCYAVGHEHAADYFQELAPFWTRFLSWIRGGHDASRFLIAQAVWHPEGHWCDIGRAVADGLLEGVAVELMPTQRAAIFTAQLSDQQLRGLIAAWWPDALGMLGGITYRGGGWKGADHEFASTGRISARTLGHVDHVFTTTSTFDELGFAVLSRNDRWVEAEAVLSGCGWTTGKPVELLAGLP